MSSNNGNGSNGRTDSVLEFTDGEIDLLVWGIATAARDLNDVAKRNLANDDCDRLLQSFRRLLPKLQLLRSHYVATHGPTEAWR